MLVGPNTGLAHTSIVLMIESQLAYISDALRHLTETGAGALEVRAEVQSAFVEEMQERHEAHGLERRRLRELVPRRLRAEHHALAGVDLGLPAAHPQLRPRRPPQRARAHPGHGRALSGMTLVERVGAAIRRVLSVPVTVARTVARLPEVVEAIAMLPTIAAQLERISEDTRQLPAIHAEMAAVALSTTQLEATMPVLVELQQPLPELVPALQQTADRLDRLATLIGSMDQTLHFLAAVAEPLQGTAARIGRWTGGRAVRRADREEAGP